MFHPSPLPHPFAQDAGPSSSSYAASTSTSTGGTGSSSRRKAPKPAVSLGLEDEVEFGSDEDLMEVVGEIPLPANQAWYPGKPDSPPKEKPKKKGLSLGSSSSSCSKSRTGLFGKDKEKKQAKGLEDARLITADEMAGRPSAVDLHSGPSLPSLVGGGGGGGRSREPSEYSGNSSLKTSNSVVGLPGSRRQKVFGKIFGGAKKGGREEDLGARGSMGAESVESFGSISRLSEVCESHAITERITLMTASNTRSILITPAHVPPTHTPTSRSSTDPPGSLSSMPRTPHSVQHASGPVSAHKQNPADIAGHAMHSHPPSGSVTHSDSVKTLDYGFSSPTKSSGRGSQNSHVGVDADMHGSRTRSESVGRKHDSGVSGRSAASSAGQYPASPATGSMYDALLPSFPTTESSIEGITILTATVFRRMSGGSGTPDKRLRPGTANSAISSFGGGSKKTVWQSHQLVLTAFRINDGTPRPTPNPNEGGRRRQPTDTRTVAHLHLFGQPQQKAASRPTSGAVGFVRKPTSAVEGIPRIELERQAIGPATTAGVWENDDPESGTAVGRKWVLRVGFEGEPEEWLCDMPTGDTLFEWVRQIKAHATVLRAEGMGYGRAIRQAHKNGHDDLNLELELHEQGLKATPRQVHASHLPVMPMPPELYPGVFGQPHDYQPGLLSPDRAVIPDSPLGVSMRDFMTRKSLSPRGQDLATFLDNADLDWRIKQAEKSRADREALGEAASVSGDVTAGVSRAGSISTGSRAKTPRQDERDVHRRSPTKAAAQGVHPAPPAGPPPACQLPMPPPSTILPPLPPLPSTALPATPSSGGGTPVTPAQGSAASTMPPMPSLPLASPPRLSPADHLTPETASQAYFADISMSGLDSPSTADALNVDAPMHKLSMEDARHCMTGASADALSASVLSSNPPPSAYAGSSSVGDDSESVSSKTSSMQRMRRKTQKQPAMDLMAELSGRPEMNFPKPGASGEDARIVVDENRPRKIRFG